MLKTIIQKVQQQRRHAEAQTNHKRMKVSLEARGRANAYKTMERLLKAELK